MSIREVQEWMEQNDKNEVDVASMLKLNPVTVKRFLKGNRVQRSTKALIESIVKDPRFQPVAQKASVG